MSECTHDCSSCESSCKSKQTAIPKDSLNFQSKVKKLIAVVSGKGGVGKSMTSALLAVLMNRRDYKTAVLDADITGPSIPRLFGINGQRAAYANDLIMPVKTKTGIAVISVNLMLEKETDPVVWRGPVIAGTVKQFWKEVFWDDVDFMFVDMPPGTGDVPLTVFQSLPLDGIIIVSSPQEVVSVIVAKAVNMAKMMNVPIIGLVENMSYVKCPCCSETIELYGKSRAEETAKEFEIPLLARVPIYAPLAALADKGAVEAFEGDWYDKAADAVEGLLK